MPKKLGKNSAAPPRWISPYIYPGSKRCLSWDKCRWLNFALEVWPFCVDSLVTLQNWSFEQLATISARLSFTFSCCFRLKMPCHVKIWSIIHSNNLYKQIIPVFGENKIAKAHRKTQENNFEWKVQPSTLVPAQKSFESWLNIGWNPTWGGCIIFF